MLSPQWVSNTKCCGDKGQAIPRCVFQLLQILVASIQLRITDIFASHQDNKKTYISPIILCFPFGLVTRNSLTSKTPQFSCFECLEVSNSFFTNNPSQLPLTTSKNQRMPDSGSGKRKGAPGGGGGGERGGKRRQVRISLCFFRRGNFGVALCHVPRRCFIHPPITVYFERGKHLDFLSMALSKS